MNRKTPGTRPRPSLSSVTPVSAPTRAADNRASSQIDSAADADPADQSKTKPSTHWEFWILRSLFTVLIGVFCYAFAPPGLRGSAAGVGLLLALVIVLAEYRLAYASIGGLIGGTAGALAGMSAALLLTLIISRTSQPLSTKSFLDFISLLAFSYLGMTTGFRCGEHWRVPRRKAKASSESFANGLMKLLDTSVLIDGRIAEICEAQFLDGVLAVPQFVLHELQLVADSSDPLKRQRGRRGLEVLQRIQKMPQVEVRVVDEDFPHTTDVDHKLIELARRTGAKIVTNDFNLNKVATVQGFSVLNVNELANALKPAVLPGETMHVLIQREGKEAMQGVAYLSDGTMVVVDGARRMINKSVDIIVTSVHQTTAGKMIFGRVDERVEPAGPYARAAAAGRGVGGNSTQSYTVGSSAAREEENNRTTDAQGSDSRAGDQNSSGTSPQAEDE
jgi:uncharacterized protein YacL